MKFIYVITSSDKDFYLEQAILSMFSLRLHNEDAEIIVLTDNRTIKSLINGREQIKQYVNDIIEINVPEIYTPMQRSRFIKTSMRQYVDGDFMFIDTDTIITDKLSGDYDGDVMAVLDKHVHIFEHPERKEIRKIAEKINWKIPKNDVYFNSGVMFVRDSRVSHKLFTDWHSNWLKGIEQYNINIDQPMLALANANNSYIIKELPGEYNCQIVENGIKYLSKSKLIHYFASGVDSSWTCPYIFRDKKIYDIIKKEGITSELNKLILNGREAFRNKCLILGGEATDIYGLPLVSIARRISRKYPSINRLLYWIFKVVGRI